MFGGRSSEQLNSLWHYITDCRESELPDVLVMQSSPLAVVLYCPVLICLSIGLNKITPTLASHALTFPLWDTIDNLRGCRIMSHE